MAGSLYVHIPFCAHICGYCDFTKVLYREEWAFSYVESLFKQFDSLEIEHPLKTIYVGGGTPSSLPSALLEKLLTKLSKYLNHDDYEFTIEANPESLTKEKLLIMKKAGVNRLSIGIESSSEKYLKLMGRKHTFIEGENAVKMAKECGFENITVDLIYGLPLETVEDVKKDVEALLKLDVPHLSTYCLSISKGTMWHKDGYKEMDDEEAALQYETILKELRNAGYIRYEVSNFARPGYESRHNMTYWRDKDYYAVGLGASGYLNGERFTFTKNLSSFIKGNYEGEREKVSINEEIEEFLLTNLRLEKGFKIDDFNMRFGTDFEDKYRIELDKLIKDGLIKVTENSVFATDKGILLLDRILLTLFK